MASPNEAIAASVEDLEKAFNEAVVQTTKAIRDSSRESKGLHLAIGASLASRLELPTHSFQTALDEIEREITRAMSVNLRDLKELREKRMPPPAAPPTTAAQETPVAPPAPMTFDGDSPIAKPAPSLGPATSVSGSRAPGPAPPPRQDSKPPAPMPDMGFDLSVSPEVRHTPSPALSQAKVKQFKASPKTSPIPVAAQMATMAPRPGSAPPKKELSSTPQHQTPRPTGSASQPPVHAPSEPVAPPAPMMEAPMSLPTSISPTAATAVPALAQGQASHGEIAFTNMAFSVAPADNEPADGAAQMQTQPSVQQQHATDDGNMLGMSEFGDPGDMSGDFGMSNFDSNMLDLTSSAMNNSSHNDSLLLNDDSSNAMLGTSDLDADIEKLFASQGPNSADKMDMDYGLDEIGLSNNNFDDINWGDDIGGDEDFGQDFNTSGS